MRKMRIISVVLILVALVTNVFCIRQYIKDKELYKKITGTIVYAEGFDRVTSRQKYSVEYKLGKVVYTKSVNNGPTKENGYIVGDNINLYMLENNPESAILEVGRLEITVIIVNCFIIIAIIGSLLISVRSEKKEELYL